MCFCISDRALSYNECVRNSAMEGVYKAAGRRTLTVLQMAVPYCSVNSISKKCTGDKRHSFRVEGRMLCYGQLLLLIHLLWSFIPRLGRK